jgi:RIO kinase 2
MKRTFRAFRNLDEDDFRVLAAMEAGLRKSEFVPSDDLRKFTQMDEPDLKYRLGRVDNLGLIQRTGYPYEGYRLLHTAYDFLALNTLVQRDVLESLGDRLAVGKESEVYEALSPDGEELVIKFHRLGLSSFHKAVRLRGYLGERRHFSWIYAARLAAEREFEALRLIHGRIPSPRPVNQNRNTVVMERLSGSELVQSDVEDPPGLLGDLLDDLKTAWAMGIIHGDLSEFNVMVCDEEYAIIDWPQWVRTDHPQAKSICSRDLANIHQFFKKKYPLEYRQGDFENIATGTPWGGDASGGDLEP